MLLRKINAGISLITTYLFLDHAILYSIWMLTRGAMMAKPRMRYVPWLLMGMMVLHAAICIYFAISAHRGAEKRKCKSYPRMNIPTVIQRASGMSMLIFIGLHIAGAASYHQPKMFYGVVQLLFFIVALAHVAFSTNKALITLGIGNIRVIKIVDIIVKVLCLATLFASAIGFYLCLFMGVVK